MLSSTDVAEQKNNARQHKSEKKNIIIFLDGTVFFLLENNQNNVPVHLHHQASTADRERLQLSQYSITG